MSLLFAALIGGAPAFADRVQVAPSIDPAADDAFDAFESTDWDSVFSAYDRETVKTKGVEPLIGLDWNKAEGIHLDGGIGFGPWLGLAERIELRAGYDLARERPNGHLLVRFGQADPLLPPVPGTTSLGLELVASDDARPFGQHDPFGNWALASVGGYDARNYLRARRGSVDLLIRRGSAWVTRIGGSREEQDPLPAAWSAHLFGPDRWMSRNLQADPVVASGVGISTAHRPPYANPEMPDGTYFRAAFERLAGGRTWSRHAVECLRHESGRKQDGWLVAAGVRVAGGDAPLQDLPDLGGAAGLRAFEPRAFVGRAAFHARAQYEIRPDLLRKSRVPLLRRAGVQFVPFAELGAAWGRRPIRRYDALVGPRRQDLRWDLGIGFRKGLLGTGQAAHCQVNVAWPMGADTGPARVTLAFSSDGVND